MVTTNSCDPANRTRSALTGSAHTGSTTRTPMPCCASRVPTSTGERPWPPAFFGMGVDKDGRTDLSVSVDEILAGGFGATRS